MPLVINGEEVLKDEERTPCEVWTRVMGYHRVAKVGDNYAMGDFNIAKQAEFAERRFYQESAARLGGAAA